MQSAISFTNTETLNISFRQICTTKILSFSKKESSESPIGYLNLATVPIANQPLYGHFFCIQMIHSFIALIVIWDAR